VKTNRMLKTKLDTSAFERNRFVIDSELSNPCSSTVESLSSSFWYIGVYLAETEDIVMDAGEKCQNWEESR
jgi:hypothetical protein